MSSVIQKEQMRKIAVAGQFNPHIVQPSWLAREGVWAPKEVQWQAFSAPSNDETFSGDQTYWRVTATELSIESAKLDVGKLVLKVLSRLPHTPVKSVTSIFSFLIDAKATCQISEDVQEADFGMSPVLHQWAFVSHVEEKRVAVLVSIGEDGTSVTITNVRKTEDSASGIAASDRFEEDEKDSRAIVANMYRLESGEKND